MKKVDISYFFNHYILIPDDFILQWFIASVTIR